MFMTSSLLSARLSLLAPIEEATNGILNEQTIQPSDNAGEEKQVTFSDTVTKCHRVSLIDGDRVTVAMVSCRK